MAKEEAVFQAQIAEGKCNLIHQLLEEYDIQISEDIQDTLKDLMGKTIKKMIEAEMNWIGYNKVDKKVKELVQL